MRDPRINPVAGDVLAIGMKQWEVVAAYQIKVKVSRDGAEHTIHYETFRSFFKLASTVRYGDEA